MDTYLNLINYLVKSLLPILLKSIIVHVLTNFIKVFTQIDISS